MRYRYEALDTQGVRSVGHCEAQSLADLDHLLAARALTLLRGQRSRNRTHPGRLSWQAHAQLCYQLYQLLQAGVPLLDALAELRDSTEPAGVADLYAGLHRRLAEGASFTQALAAQPRQFDSLLRQGMQAAEASGHMAEVLAELHRHYQWREQMQKQSRKAWAYPAFAGVVLLGASSFLLVYLMPQVREFVADTGAPLPMATRVLLALTGLLAQSGLALLGSAAVITVLVCLAWRQSSALRDYCARQQLRLPVLGAMHINAAVAQYAHSLGLLYDAGVPLLEALKIAESGIVNLALLQSMRRARLQVECGSSLALAFAQIPQLPPLLLTLLRTGEHTGQLGHALQQAASFCQQELKSTSERLQAMIEPGMTLVLGGLLAWVMLAVLGPVFDSLGQLR